MTITRPVGTPVSGARTGSPVDSWVATHTSVEFATLRMRLRRFVFPMTAFFLAWYFLYVLLAAFAPQVMAVPVAGNLNVGLIFGLLQFASTFAITMVYVRFANRNLDPLSIRIREQIEGETW